MSTKLSIIYSDWQGPSSIIGQGHSQHVLPDPSDGRCQGTEPRAFVEYLLSSIPHQHVYSPLKFCTRRSSVVITDVSIWFIDNLSPFRNNYGPAARSNQRPAFSEQIWNVKWQNTNLCWGGIKKKRSLPGVLTLCLFCLRGEETNSGKKCR